MCIIFLIKKESQRFLLFITVTKKNIKMRFDINNLTKY
jgi:hypothetical protein